MGRRVEMSRKGGSEGVRGEGGSEGREGGREGVEV